MGPLWAVQRICWGHEVPEKARAWQRPSPVSPRGPVHQAKQGDWTGRPPGRKLGVVWKVDHLHLGFHWEVCVVTSANLASAGSWARPAQEEEPS